MYKNRLINHFRHFHSAVDALCEYFPSLLLDCHTFTLTLKTPQKNILFYPQFMTVLDNQLHYVSTFNTEATIFCGWRPYLPIQLSFFTDKLAFKALLTQHNFNTPPYTLNQNQLKQDYLIKTQNTSFADGLLGPFNIKSDPIPPLKKNQYYETFIFGDIIKIWFWNDHLVCLEQQPMTHVTGDGYKTIRSLLEERVESRWLQLQDPFPFIQTVLNYYDTHLDEILPYGHTKTVDIRYASSVADPADVSDHSNLNGKLSLEYPVLEALGRLLYDSIKPYQPNYVYTVDAILDQEENLWFLEGNTNPAIHPQVYTEMLYALLYPSHT